MSVRELLGSLVRSSAILLAIASAAAPGGARAGVIAEALSLAAGRAVACASLFGGGACMDDNECGGNEVCENNTCQPLGACCIGAQCQQITAGACAAANGVFLSTLLGCSGSPCDPPNDECEGAILISGPLPATVSGSTLTATNSPEPPALGTCGTSHDTAGDLWYRVIGTGNTMTVTTCNPGTNYDTKLHVYCGACASTGCLGGNDDSNTAGCGLPNSSGFKSRVTWCSESGTEYLVLVHGFTEAAGFFQMTVSDDGAACSSPSVCAPPADECDDAPLLTGSFPISVVGSTINASFSGEPPVIENCGDYTHDGANDVWYRVTGTGLTMSATTCSPLTDYDIAKKISECVVTSVGSDDSAVFCAGIWDVVDLEIASLLTAKHGIRLACAQKSFFDTIAIVSLQDDTGQSLKITNDQYGHATNNTIIQNFVADKHINIRPWDDAADQSTQPTYIVLDVGTITAPFTNTAINILTDIFYHN